MKQTRFATLCVALGLASFFNLSAQAQMTTITDATNDIAAGINTAGGTLDIVKMEVGDTASDVVFKLTVNGNVSTTDWGKFMIGIANQKTNGTTTGNGWSRPINLNAGVTNGVTNGMTHWIGSWVDGGNGANLFAYSGTAWTETAATYSGNLPGFSVTSGSQSVITYTVSKTSLGVTNGDTIKFDAYSSGGGTPDSAVDALANPNVSITGWGGPYTSSGANLASYTLAETMLNTTQTITFSVNMSHQILLGTFDPATDAVAVDWGTGFPPANFAYLTRVGTTSVYTGTATISAVQGTSVPYRFTMEPPEPAALIPETVSRSFNMPGTALTVASSYYNNIEGYRDVTFAVNMSVQETLGTFNPATQTVEVRGPFNAWAGTALTAQGSGIYSGTVRISGAAGPVDYKFFAGSYESISGNRNFTLAFNTDGAPTPALVLNTDFYNNVSTVPAFRPVTFAVNMNRQITLGRFVAGTDTLEVVGAMNGWNGGTSWQLTDGDSDGIYTGTFNIEGAAAATVEYKFRASGTASWESIPNRSLTLGPVQTAQTVSTVFFNNDSGQTRQVTFAVNMGVQQQLGNFDPATGVVQLRGLGGFGDAEAQALTRQGETLIYSGTFSVPGDEGSSFAYKFWATGLTYETVDPNDGFVNRTLVLGASGTPQTASTAFFSNVSEVPQSRQVTYAVDMSVQIFKGAFDPSTNGVEVRGDFNSFSGGVSTLVRDGTSSIYTNTFTVAGAEGSTNKFKFFSTGTNAVGYEDGADREAVLTANAVPLNTGTNFFSGVSESRKITFRVDMTTQIAKGNFNVSSNTVSVAGSFNGWNNTNAVTLSAQGGNVYAAEVTVDGPVSAIEYKFLNGTTFEGSVSNRTITAVLPNLQASTLTAVLFNGDDGIGPVITRNGSATVNLTVGDSYTDAGATATDAVDGSVTVTPSGTVNTAVAGTYTITYNASDAAGNAATPVTRTVVVAAAPSGSTFAGWAGGATLDATNVGKYAIGGASSPTATDGVKPTSTVSGGNLVLTAIVRTDDSKLTVVAEAVTNLANYGTPASITEINGVDTADQTGVPAGHKRQTFTVAQGSDARKFLRLKATLQP